MDPEDFASFADENVPLVIVASFLLQYFSDSKRKPYSDKCYFPASCEDNKTIAKIRNIQIENSDPEKLLVKELTYCLILLMF